MIPLQPQRPRRALLLCLVFSFLLSLPLWAAEKARLRVDDYQIDAELTPHSHKISARAKVKFTALEDLSIATFELHNALRVTKVVDAAGKLLSAERVTQDSTIRVPLTTPVAKDSSSTLTFEYEGVLDSADDSPVQGLKLAYISDDTTLSAVCRALVSGECLWDQPFYRHHEHHRAGAHDRDRQREREPRLCPRH